jgi:hypothetical protein
MLEIQAVFLNSAGTSKIFSSRDSFATIFLRFSCLSNHVAYPRTRASGAPA